MNIIYQAFDGKQFNTKEECKNYEHEQGLDSIGNEIVGLDYLDKKLSTFPSPDFLYRLSSFRVDTGKAVDVLVNLLENDGYTTEGIYEPGMYIWGAKYNYDNCWVKLEKIYNDYKEKINEIENIMNTLENM